MGNDDITDISQMPEELLCTYIHACHILHYHGLVNAYGHISVRLSPSSFLMSRYMAPPLIASTKDLVVYKVENGEPVADDAPRGLYCAPNTAS
jgi:ribulose-5-phosphate 4-epimerase/fuculose-1-phosphate aldolase